MPPAIRRAPQMPRRRCWRGRRRSTQAKQRIAWTIIGQVSFNQADYASAENAFAHALAAAAPNDPERADITERLAAAVYKQGDAKRSCGRSGGRGAGLPARRQLAPGSKITATAQYDAAASLIIAQQWDQAIAVLEAYRRDYPKSEYAADVDRKLAVAYEQGGHAGQAAAQYRADRRQSEGRPRRGARGDHQGRRSISAVGR